MGFAGRTTTTASDFFPCGQASARLLFEIAMTDQSNAIAVNEQDPRVRLAAERTLLAWMRTGLAMMGFGFVVARFGLFLNELAIERQQPAHRPSWSMEIGIALVLFGVFVNLIAAWEHAQILGRLKRGEPLRPSRWSLGILVAVALAAFGIAMAAHLVFLQL